MIERQVDNFDDITRHNDELDQAINRIRKSIMTFYDSHWEDVSSIAQDPVENNGSSACFENTTY